MLVQDKTHLTNSVFLIHLRDLPIEGGLANFSLPGRNSHRVENCDMAVSQIIEVVGLQGGGSVEIVTKYLGAIQTPTGEHIG